jgi:hypothetical protein
LILFSFEQEYNKRMKDITHMFFNLVTCIDSLTVFNNTSIYSGDLFIIRYFIGITMKSAARFLRWLDLKR